MLFELFGDGEQADSTIGDLNSSQLGLTGNHSTGCMSAKEARVGSPNTYVLYNISTQPCLLTWKVPNKRPPKLYELMYRCNDHWEMRGLISKKNTLLFNLRHAHHIKHMCLFDSSHLIAHHGSDIDVILIHDDMLDGNMILYILVFGSHS